METNGYANGLKIKNEKETCLGRHFGTREQDVKNDICT